MRLRTAELEGTITTTAGTLKLRAFVHSSSDLLAVEITPSEGEQGFRWVFHPADAISPRADFKPLPDGYTGNPPAVVEQHGEVTAAVQPLLAGGQHVTAWRERTRGDSRTLYVTVTHSTRRRPHVTARCERSRPPPPSRTRCSPPRIAPGGTGSTGRVSCHFRTPGCSASTGSSSTRRPRRPARTRP